MYSLFCWFNVKRETVGWSSCLLTSLSLSLTNTFCFLFFQLDNSKCLLTNCLCASSGGRGGYGGGDRRRDSYRDGGSGPDRHQHGGNRSRPYWGYYPIELFFVMRKLWSEGFYNISLEGFLNWRLRGRLFTYLCAPFLTFSTATWRGYITRHGIDF